MDFTPRLALPYLLPNQAQKFVTHNEALSQLDTLTGLCLMSRTITTEPLAPDGGDVYVLPDGASGTHWDNFSPGALVARIDDAWVEYPLTEGLLAWIADENQLVVYTDGDWQLLGGETDQFAELGINTSPDETNRLAVKSDAVLFSHTDEDNSPGDIRHTLNRSSTGDVASILFQTGFSAGAEIGLVGSDDFDIRVSSDGSVFRTALRASSADGKVAFPNGFQTPLSVQDSIGIRHRLGSIANDSAAHVDFGAAIFGSIIVAIPNSLNAGAAGIFFARMASSPDINTLFSAGYALTTQTGELTGTSGADNRINFSVTSTGKFYIENRRGYSIGYTIYIFR